MNIDIHQKKVELSEIGGILFDMASDIVCDLNIERHTVVRKMLDSAEYEKLLDYNRERLRLYSLSQALKSDNEAKDKGIDELNELLDTERVRVCELEATNSIMLEDLNILQAEKVEMERELGAVTVQVNRPQMGQLDANRELVNR